MLKLRRVGGWSLLALALGCSTTPQLTDEVSFDGLVRVENTGFEFAWIRPGADLSRYAKVMLQGAGIEFRPVKPGEVSAGGEREFLPSQAQRERLREIMREAFVREMLKSERFQLVREPGPDVLLMRGALLDVVSFVPPEQRGGETLMVSAVGEGTLVLELRDSESEAILARIADRKAAERMGGEMLESTPTMNRYDVARGASAWANLARRRLEDLARLSEPSDR